jgi:hypothetical protein
MPALARRTFLLVALFLAGTAVFAAASGQAPLYYSNQNQYFLHGLARADIGLLREDWLANTRDATPVFSTLVAWTVSYLHPLLFHVWYALLMGAYATAMLGLFAVVAPENIPRRWPIFVALFVLCHAALPRWVSYRWLGQDYPWYLQAGVAGQYVLGAMFQPSTFGVLLIVALCLFVRGHALLAAACAALAATAHSTYLLPAGLLVAGFLASLLVEGRPRQALAVASVALLLVAPVTAYVLLTFGPTDSSTFAEAQKVLVDVRIPHHCRVDLWLDGVAGLQLAWVVLGIALARPRRLAIVLAVPALLALALTVAQVATSSTTLALLFPWRISVVLVPVATTVILSRLVAALPAAVEGRAAWAAAFAVVAICVSGGVWIMAARLGYHTADEELPLLAFARRTSASGDVWFLPVNVPDPARVTRGAGSSDFKPLVEKKQGIGAIPYDLQRFRLTAAVPIFVDFKSIPYKDAEVIQWYQRIRQAQQVQARLGEGKIAEALGQLRPLGITYLVLPAGLPLRDSAAEPVYADEHYRVYHLQTGR